MKLIYIELLHWESQGKMQESLEEKPLSQLGLQDPPQEEIEGMKKNDIKKYFCR